jgi:hypothetical protein
MFGVSTVADFVQNVVVMATSIGIVLDASTVGIVLS